MIPCNLFAFRWWLSVVELFTGGGVGYAVKSRQKNMYCKEQV